MYDSGRLKVYLNALVAVLAIIFSVITLTRPLNTLLLVCYFSLSMVVAFLAYKFKVFLQSRTQEKLFTAGQIEHKTQADKWKPLLIFMGAIIFALILPLILVFVLEPAYWFLSFTSIVTGVSLSEIILYYVGRQSKE